jgi:hypothetical protein
LWEVVALNCHHWLASMKTWNTVFCASFANCAPSGLITLQLWSLNAVLYVCELTLDLKVVPLVPGIQSSRLLFDSVSMQFLWCNETTWLLCIVVVASDYVTAITATRALWVHCYKQCMVSYSLWRRFFGSSSLCHVAECYILKIGKLTFLSQACWQKCALSCNSWTPSSCYIRQSSYCVQQSHGWTALLKPYLKKREWVGGWGGGGCSYVHTP